MKCVTYRRVSTEHQREEGYSLEAQRERLRNYIQSQGWVLVEEYADEGVSAKDIDRPGLKQLLSDMKLGKFEVVLVYKLDRLVRSVTDLHYLLSEFDKYKVAFKSSTEVFETTSAMGRLFITIVGAMAAWEREALGERVLMGMGRKVVEGKRAGAVAPWGYDLTDDGSLVINDKESPWVKWVFENYKTMSLRKICEELDKRGVRTKKGMKWIASTLNYVVTNPVYYGALRWSHNSKSKGDVIISEETHPPIITKELFDEVQALRGKRTNKGFKPSYDYPFSGVLLCSNCGGRLVGGKYKYKGVTKRLYRCKNDRVFDCKMPLVQEELIENWYLNHNFLNDLKLGNKKIIQPEIQGDTSELKKELEKIETRKKRLMEIYEEFEDEMTPKEFKKRMNLLKEREKEIKIQLEEQGGLDVTPEQVDAILRELKENWYDLTEKERQAFISSTIKDVKVKVIKKGTRTKPAEIKVLDYQWILS